MEHFCEKLHLSKYISNMYTQQQQTTNTFDKPQPPSKYNQNMWALKSNFRWMRSIHHHFSGRKGGWVAVVDWGRHWRGEQPGNQTGTIKTGTGSKRSHSSSSSGSFSFPPFSLLLLLQESSSTHGWEWTAPSTIREWVGL